MHTWGQNLSLHPHVHCVIPGGGLSSDGSRWVACRAGFFLPVTVLSRVFRGKFIDLLRRRHGHTPLHGVIDDNDLERLFDASVRTDWVVYAKPPFGGPGRVLKYLARYTHRIAISNRRLVSMDDETVTFRWKDYSNGNRPKLLTLEAGEFLRRFLMHVVPSGFTRIRHFGLLANRLRSANLKRCRELLSWPVPSLSIPIVSSSSQHRCPVCGEGLMTRSGMVMPILVPAVRKDTS